MIESTVPPPTDDMTDGMPNDGPKSAKLAQLFEAIRERDVDLLILEEFCSSKRFRAWWLEKMGYRSADEPTVVDARHSWSIPGAGESDLVFAVENRAGEKFGVLIEVKIDAPPQLHQPERYIERGKRGVEGKEWSTFVTCLAARTTYLDSHSDGYHHRVSFEEISDWFTDEHDEITPKRAEYKIRLLDAAINPAHRGSPPVVEVLEATQFASDYLALAAAEFPQLRLALPQAKGARFVRIAFHGEGHGRRLVHHFRLGYVDLQVKGHAEKLGVLQTANAALAEDDIRIVAAGGSGAFRIRVSAIDPLSDAAPQADQIREALHAVQRLHELGPKIRI